MKKANISSTNLVRTEQLIDPRQQRQYEYYSERFFSYDVCCYEQDDIIDIVTWDNRDVIIVRINENQEGFNQCQSQAQVKMFQNLQCINEIRDHLLSQNGLYLCINHFQSISIYYRNSIYHHFELFQLCQIKWQLTSISGMVVGKWKNKSVLACEYDNMYDIQTPNGLALFNLPQLPLKQVNELMINESDGLIIGSQQIQAGYVAMVNDKNIKGNFETQALLSPSITACCFSSQGNTFMVFFPLSGKVNVTQYDSQLDLTQQCEVSVPSPSLPSPFASSYAVNADGSFLAIGFGQSMFDRTLQILVWHKVLSDKLEYSLQYKLTEQNQICQLKFAEFDCSVLLHYTLNQEIKLSLFIEPKEEYITSKIVQQNISLSKEVFGSNYKIYTSSTGRIFCVNNYRLLILNGCEVDARHGVSRLLPLHCKQYLEQIMQLLKRKFHLPDNVSQRVKDVIHDKYVHEWFTPIALDDKPQPMKQLECSENLAYTSQRGDRFTNHKQTSELTSPLSSNTCYIKGV